MISASLISSSDIGNCASESVRAGSAALRVRTTSGCMKMGRLGLTSNCAHKRQHSPKHDCCRLYVLYNPKQRIHPHKLSLPPHLLVQRVRLSQYQFQLLGSYAFLQVFFRRQLVVEPLVHFLC